MNFEERVLQKGVLLYKGIRSSTGEEIHCTSLQNTDKFFLSEYESTAIMYANPYMCTFKTKKQLKLFVMSHSNVRKLISGGLDQQTRNKLLAITGTNLTVRQQMNLFTKFSQLPSGKIGRIIRNLLTTRPTTRGGRLSIHEFNKNTFNSLCPILKSLGYDGYIARELHSPYHRGGLFHAEIMLCDAAGALKIESETNKRSGMKSQLNLPLISMSTMQKDIPKIFRNWVKNHPIPTLPRNLYPYLTGGMAAKVILKSKGKKSVSSGDFDFTIARPVSPINITDLETDSEIMRVVFEPYLNSFVENFRRYFPQLNIQISRRINPIRIPGIIQDVITGRVLHQVVTYILIINGKTFEFVDLALCTVPGINSSMLQNQNGFPTLKTKLLIKNISATLAKSFLSSNIFNKKRNPLTGEAKNKGLKNIQRIKNLCSLNTNSKVCNQIYNLNRTVKTKNLRSFIIAKQIWNSLRNNNVTLMNINANSLRNNNVNMKDILKQNIKIRNVGVNRLQRIKPMPLIYNKQKQKNNNPLLNLLRKKNNRPGFFIQAMRNAAARKNLKK